MMLADMDLTDKQKAAHKLASEYLGYLDQQEALVERIIDRKWKQLEPKIELLIERKINEYLSARYCQGNEHN